MSIVDEIKESFKTGSILTKLIYVNLAVFVIYNLVQALFLLTGNGDSFNLMQYLAVPAYIPNLALHPWTIITYMFFHEGFLHILFNLLWLYWFGQIFLGFMSQQKMLGVYIMGGIAGALLYMLFYNIFPHFHGALPISYALGASASVYAIVVATATYSPNLQLNLMFIGPVRLKYIALFMLMLDIISIAGSNAGGHIAHLGGALFGYFYVVLHNKGYDMAKPAIFIIDMVQGLWKPKPRMKVNYKKADTDFDYNKRKKEQQAKVDAILDKIAKSGYEKLTAEEKEILFKMKDK